METPKLEKKNEDEEMHKTEDKGEKDEHMDSIFESEMIEDDNAMLKNKLKVSEENAAILKEKLVAKKEELKSCRQEFKANLLALKNEA